MEEDFQQTAEAEKVLLIFQEQGFITSNPVIFLPDPCTVFVTEGIYCTKESPVLTDAELVQQALAGEVESFGQLVNRHRGAVQGLAYHWVGNFENAEDIAQETLVTAYLKLGQLRQPECFSAWLRQLTLNHCRKWWRKHQDTMPLAEVEESVAGGGLSPLEELEQRETRRLVHRSLAQLSDNNRLVITLHYLGGMSCQEIARFLDVPLSTVEGRLRRAKEQLKGHLMQTVEDTLRREQLGDDFTREVLEQARKRARETQSQWQRDDFVLSIQKGLEAARQLQDPKAQIEMLSMLGEASSSWLGEAGNAITHYESGLEIARAQGAKEEEARLLKALYLAHGRHGEYGKMLSRAGEALAAWAQLGNGPEQAQARAALDLAENLPGVWYPDQAGGYAIAAFPLETGEEGYRWGDPAAVRHYSWGCPSRCAAFMHLFRPRRFLGAALELGAQWDDRVAHLPDGLSWGTDPSEPESLAHSVIEGLDDRVATPAGRFASCLRVKTTLTAPGGGTALEHRTRSYCGVRTAWFARGVGLVKLRHQDQNGALWTVCLTAHEGPPSEAFFPLEVGHRWRFRWLDEAGDKIVFEDLCRVVGSGEGRACFSSATWAKEQTKEEVRVYFEHQLALEQTAGDREGQRMALERLTLFSEDESQRRACGQQLAEIFKEQGDEWGLLQVQQTLRQKQGEGSPAAQERQIEERLDLARRLGDRGKELPTLRELGDHYLHNKEYQRAARFFAEYATAAREEGDMGKAAKGICQAELACALQDRPEDPHCAYRCGDGQLMEKEATLAFLGSSRWNHSQHYPSDSQTTPMTDFLWLTPFDGIGLLGREVGASCTDVHNTGLGGICESMRMKCAVKSDRERVEVPAGRFSGCVLIETVISTSAEGRPLEEELLEAARGYFAGVKEAWFAPGVGLVRLRYRHRNGYETQVELLEYETAQESNSYLPLALDNRWRYAWTDQESGTRFEDRLRVASHREGRWNFAFVTRAEMAEHISA